MEADCKVFGLVGDWNCSALGWSKRLWLKLVGSLVGFRRKEDCKQQAGVLVGRMEKGFLAVARVDHKKLQQ